MTLMTFKTHITLKQFSCGECCKTYQSKQNYQRHIKSNIHKKQVRLNNGHIETLYCKCCNKHYKSKYYMALNLKRII